MSNSVAPHKAITKLFVFAYLMGVILQAVSESERARGEANKSKENGKQKTFTDYQQQHQRDE